MQYIFYRIAFTIPPFWVEKGQTQPEKWNLSPGLTHFVVKWLIQFEIREFGDVFIKCGSIRRICHGQC